MAVQKVNPKAKKALKNYEDPYTYKHRNYKKQKDKIRKWNDGLETSNKR